MADGIPRCMSAALLQKLHALAERRCAHLIELQQSGRWTHYYSEDALVALMKEAAASARHWAEMVEFHRAAELATESALYRRPGERSAAFVRAALH
jgi:hypothetical protein